MKKFFLMGIMVCLAMVANAQRSMEWYSYWGSNIAGSQIEPQRMVVDNDGNIYVAAIFGGDKVAAESTTLSSNSSADKGDAVIIKVSPTKQILWTYSIVEAGNATIADLAIDQYGNIFVTGAFTNSIKVGSKVMPIDNTNEAEAAIYVLKLRNDGSAVRAWQIAAQVEANAGTIAIDSENNVIVAGTITGEASFVWEGGVEGDMNNNNQMFVAKYENDGTLIWHQFRNDNGASSYGRAYVATDAQNNIYVASTIDGSTTFNGNALSCTISNAILFAYNAAGEEQWSHMIKGDLSDETAAIAVSPIGQVIIAINHHSYGLKIDDMEEEFKTSHAFNTAGALSGFFSFDLSGNFKWHYEWGYCNDDASSDAANAHCYSLRCTDEGVIYVAGMMTGRYGGSRLPNTTLDNGKNSGVEAVDHQWIAHNTNGGQDCYLLTLTRGGKLANVIRPGGPQYEYGIDVALSPDKKSLYFLQHINVRNNVPYTCPDNIFDSWTDLYAPSGWASRKSNYTLLNVYCPENDGSDTKYGKDYKGVFASSLLVKYAMPEINPNMLPYFTANEAYSQALNIANAQGKVTLFPLEKSGDVEFDGATVSGTFDTEADRYCGVLAIDSIALPGTIGYYGYDPSHRSLRSTPRNLRYFDLTIEKTAPVTPEDPDQPEEPVIPSDKQGFESIHSAAKAQKYLYDGVLYIERNGKTYNAQGAIVKQ